MTKEQFQAGLRSLLPDAAEGAEEIWADFARECVEMGQFVDCVEEPVDLARSRWYDALLAGFVLLKRDFGEETARFICNLSLENQCLYPYEMERAGQEVKAGGDAGSLFRLMEEGKLDAPTLVFPKLRDVLQQQDQAYPSEMRFQL